jgi:pyruvate dehydrogenase E2 component (dihydrolipoamide acetyltransferase)
VVRAVAQALKAHPVINASLDLDKSQIIYKQYVHIGIAVDTDRGLIVPVLRDVPCKSVLEIARSLEEVAQRVRSGKFDPAELRGGTFSISNLGSLGGRYSTPIINYPQSAVLLLGRARQMPVVLDDQLVPRLMLPLSLSYDHRLIDGATAQRFLNDLIAHLQNPGRLLLE